MATGSGLSNHGGLYKKQIMSGHTNLPFSGGKVTMMSEDEYMVFDLGVLIEKSLKKDDGKYLWGLKTKDAQLIARRIATLTAEVERLREAYEKDCTPAYEEIALRNQSLTTMNDKKQRLLEQACKEHGHDWRGDGDHCLRCGVADWIASSSDSSGTQQEEAADD